MFTNKKPNYERPATVISKDTTLDMKLLKSKESIQVNGQVTGDVEVTASVVIGQGGKVKGDIKASFILVAGTIEGNLLIENQVHLTKSAIVVGNIKCGSLVVDEGSVLHGQCDMKEQPEAAKTKDGKVALS